jgi:PKD repeat protein
MKISVLVILTGVLALSIMSVPVYAVDNLKAHTLTVSTDSSSYSCTSPIGISGIATGRDVPRRVVRLTITNDQTGLVVATGTAKVSHGAYSTTISFTDTSMAGGYFTVTAGWYGQVAQTDGSFYWAC